MLKSVNRGGATYNAKMADILAELYTTSTSIFLGRQMLREIRDVL